jgi:DNA-binding IscR family transcriptional regulator
VRELSLGGRRIKEIAEAVGLNPDYVVKIRARLRREGKLPPL